MQFSTTIILALASTIALVAAKPMAGKHLLGARQTYFLGSCTTESAACSYTDGDGNNQDIQCDPNAQCTSDGNACELVDGNEFANCT